MIDFKQAVKEAIEECDGDKVKLVKLFKEFEDAGLLLWKEGAIHFVGGSAILLPEEFLSASDSDITIDRDHYDISNCRAMKYTIGGIKCVTLVQKTKEVIE